MLAQTMNSKISLRGAPLAAKPQKAQKPAARSVAVVAQRQRTDERQGPSDAVLKAVSLAAAVQMAFLPLAGSALAAKAAKPKAEAGIEKGFEPPLESAKRQAGDAQKKALPEGAFNPSVREDRNARNAKGLVQRFALIKDRTSASGALANNAYGDQNIFAPFRNTDGKQPLKPRGQPVSFQLSAPARAPGLVFATVKLPDLGSTTPKADPSAPSGSNKQADLPFSPQDAVNAVKGLTQKAGPTEPQGSGGAAQQFKNSLSGAAITDNSPAKQLADNIRKPVSWVDGSMTATPVGLADPGGAGGANRDRESNYGGENSVGEVTPGSDPKKGGDLKNSANKFALEFQGEKPSTDTAAFGSGTPKTDNTKNIRDDQQIPNFLGGKGFLRDDNISPEQAAQDNIATAREGKGSILDQTKKALRID